MEKYHNDINNSNFVIILLLTVLQVSEGIDFADNKGTSKEAPLCLVYLLILLFFNLASF